MKKLLLALALCLCASPGWAQCNGVFPAQTLCGNLGPTAAPPHAISSITSVYGPTTTTSGDIPNWLGIVGQQLADQQTISTSQNIFFNGITSATTFYTSNFFYRGNPLTLPTSGTVPCLGCFQTWTGQNTFTASTTITNLTTPLTVPNGGTGLATIPAHTIVLGEGTAATSNTGAGVAKQCLVSGGASADPVYANCLTLLNTLVANNSATLSDTTSFTATYSSYLVVFETLIPVTTASQTAELQVHTAGSFPATSYVATVLGTATANTISNPTTFIPLSNTSTTITSAVGLSGSIRVFNPSNTTNPKIWVGSGMTYNGANASTNVFSGFWNGGNGAVDGFQVLFGTGNITSGVIKIYGVQ